MTSANSARPRTKEKAESFAMLFILFCKNNDAPRAVLAVCERTTLTVFPNAFRIMREAAYLRFEQDERPPINLIIARNINK